MKKIVALLTALVMAISSSCALAENIKHERVFVVASGDGTIQSLTDSIRLENQDASDTLNDRTMLSSIENLTGDETFTLDGETLIWDANGHDITYQGTSSQAPAIIPVVSLTLNGEAISAGDLKDRTGECTLTVDFRTQSAYPILAVSVLPLPTNGIADLTLENATVLSEAGMQLLVGWAVPGVETDVNLPDHFSASFQADHVDLAWMMTLSSADPIEALRSEIADRLDVDPSQLLEDATKILTALKNGTEMPETQGKTRTVVTMIDKLNNGLSDLADGSAQLVDGASSLSSGASQLNDGLSNLADGVDTLLGGTSDVKDGASQLKDGADALETGASKLQDGASQLDAGIVSLTEAVSQIATGASQLKSGANDLADGAKTLSDGAANARDGAFTLDAGLKTLNENAADLNAGAAMLFDAVLASANAQLASSGLDAMGLSLPELTTQNYESVLTAAVDQLKGAGAESSENTPLALAYASLSALKDQLDQVKTFVEGLRQYTEGVSQASEGTAALAAGIQELSDGAQALSEGADALKTGASTLATGSTKASLGGSALKTGSSTLVEGMVTLHDGTVSLRDGASALFDGTSALYDGTVTLKDGADQLKDGAQKLYDGSVTLSNGTKTFDRTGVKVLKTSLTGAEKMAAIALLPYLENEVKDAVQLYASASSEDAEIGYDLRPEDMKTITVYIIRTDLQ